MLPLTEDAWAQSAEWLVIWYLKNEFEIIGGTLRGSESNYENKWKDETIKIRNFKMINGEVFALFLMRELRQTDDNFIWKIWRNSMGWAEWATHCLDWPAVYNFQTLNMEHVWKLLVSIREYWRIWRSLLWKPGPDSDCSFGTKSDEKWSSNDNVEKIFPASA